MPKSVRKPLSITPVPPRPITNSYWVTPHLLACEYPHSPLLPKSKVDALLMAGIRTFIDLTEPDELVPYAREIAIRASKVGLPQSEIDKIEYHRFAIPDRCIPPSPSLLSEIMTVLEDCEHRGRKAAVHCRGGVGRTGTIVGCWLVQSGIAENGREALQFIEREWCQVEKSKRFPRSPETGQQEDYVRHFQKVPSRSASPMVATFTAVQ